MKAVFDVSRVSAYDDLAYDRYNFPDRYLPVVRQAVGDWVVHRETKGHGGRYGYLSVAKVDRIEPDRSRPGHSYARYSDYVPFDGVVSMVRADGNVWEGALRGVARRALGTALQGRSTRLLSDADFSAIVRKGLVETLDERNAVRLQVDGGRVDPETRVLLELSLPEQERRIAQILVSRPIREASFRRRVCDAYSDTCAVTGIRIVNGGGKTEVQACHVVPVKDGGPDVVQNGIALCGTVHWLFDRQLISLTDDYRLLVSHNKVPGPLRGLFAGQNERIRLPADERDWPRPDFVRRHREAACLG